MKKGIIFLIVTVFLVTTCSCGFSSANLSEEFVDAFSENNIEIIKAKAVINGTYKKINTENSVISLYDSIIKSFDDNILYVYKNSKGNDIVFESYLTINMKNEGVLNVKVINEKNNIPIICATIDKDNISEKFLDEFITLRNIINNYANISNKSINIIATYKGQMNNQEAKKEFLKITNLKNNILLKNKLIVDTRYSKYDNKTYATFTLNN